MRFDDDEQGEENKPEGELRNKGVCVWRGVEGRIPTSGP